MKKIYLIPLISLFIIPLLSVSVDAKGNFGNQAETTNLNPNKLENRENNIERIRERIASTTASTSAKNMEVLNKRLQTQLGIMNKARERFINKETQVITVLQKIADKITERINILETRGLDLTLAKNKLADASKRIGEIIVEAEKVADLIATEITEENQAQLTLDIRTAQNNIRTMSKEAHALLVDTIKEITKVLPAKTTATTTIIN